MPSLSDKKIAYWLLTGCFLILCMIVIGGITRLTGSGLSMVEWKLIMGVLPPFSETEWQSTFNNYKQFPQYKMINFEMTLEEFKSIFLWEYIHRMWGRLIGIVFIIPFVFFLYKKWINKLLLNKLLVLFTLGAIQGIIGWWMVKSGLVDRPNVSAYRLTIHLSLAVITLCYSLWLALGLLQPKNHENQIINTNVIKLSYIITALIFIQIIWGGFMAGLKAGLFYSTFPKIKGQWIPDGMWVMDPPWKNLFENITTVQFIHRTTGILLVVLIIILWVMSMRKLPNYQLKVGVNLLLFLVIVQVALGIFTLINSVPITLAVLHQIFAIILLMSSVHLNHLTKTA